MNTRAPLLILLLGILLLAGSASAGSVQASFGMSILSAACVSGDNVRLGEIARPLGDLPVGQWERLSKKELWPAPPAGRPMVMNQGVLERMLKQNLGEMAGTCVLPQSLAIQRGGKVLMESDLASLVVKSLTPMAQSLDGEAEFRDYRLPEYLFLAHEYHRVSVELVSDLAPGRLSINLLELDAENRTHRQVSSSVFMDLWANVPCAARPVNRGKELTVDLVTHCRKNLAYLRDEVWDGRGGPWRITKPVGAEQVLYKNSLEPLPLVARGETVNLVYQGNFIRLQVVAEALDDGGHGESILVRNMDSNKQVLARVLDADTVQVR